MPTGTRSVTGSATAPPMVRYFSVTGVVSATAMFHGRFDVHDDGAHGERNPTRWNNPPQDVVNQHEFIPGGVRIPQRGDSHIRPNDLLQVGNDRRVFFLNADDPLLGLDVAHRLVETLDDGFSKNAKKFLVLMEEGFTLGGVNQDGVGLSAELDVCGKPGASGTDDSRVRNLFNRYIRHRSLVCVRTAVPSKRRPERSSLESEK